MDSSSSPIFDEYAQDLSTLLTAIRTQLDGAASQASQASQAKGDESRALLRRLEMELDESDEIIGQMEIEVQTQLNPLDKQDLQTKLRRHTTTLAAIRQQIVNPVTTLCPVNPHRAQLNHRTSQPASQKRLQATTDRDDLLSTSSRPHVTIPISDSEDPLRSASSAQAQRIALMSTTDQLSQGQRRLQESHRVALETEDLGAGILRDLRGQRDVLEHARDGLYETDGSIDRASNTIGNMVRVMHQQKAITYAIIGVLVFLM
ncbi:BZ3500_MvSof-1268-A1-R1_Chr6-3g08650 [Microbotryum saponariae]|uniref:BZ3500_MvSof-1268-A1-R1_Chr6-3g08650 protein n=1 Tax=Microbotryum saponariae TaxID=289078 RepID=A0A2X0LC21_9BASI|nr:BZ3500_MvSof-1268-A1-R1_Chr6-3g08650 [Microbotryum saponariae]SDA07251.1 BZ3501_MvSof-1269-A2-R1_Chr6-2g08353 [Microbotryum saponariae]